jgi:hypothetical protein
MHDIFVDALSIKSNICGTSVMQSGTKLNGYGIPGTPITPAIC